MRLFMIVLLCGIAHFTTNAQIGIGTLAPDPSSVLDLTSDNRGLLIPRMNTLQRDSIVNPAIGLQIFNLDDHCLDLFDGTSWIKNCGMRVTATVPSPLWTQVANFPDPLGIAPCGFSVNGKVYVGPGFSSPASNAIWEYDPQTDQWTEKASYPGLGRRWMIGCSLGNKGYMGTGTDENDVPVNDFWEYDPQTDTWTQRANVGGSPRSAAFAFALGDQIFVGSGAETNSFWAWDSNSNTWTQKADFPSTTLGMVSFSIAPFGYAGFGTNTQNSMDMGFWQYDPADNVWLQKTSPASSPLSLPVGFAIGSTGYVGTGFSNEEGPVNIFWKYNPALDSWSLSAPMPDNGRTAALGLAVDGKGFVTGGVDGFNGLNDSWVFDPAFPSPQYETTLPVTHANSIIDGIWSRQGIQITANEQHMVGLGLSSPANKLDIHNGDPRSGTHPTGLALYVTGDLTNESNGVEFRNKDGWQGIGFGSNTIYATGTNEHQDLILKARGAGNLRFTTNNAERLRINGDGHIGIGTPEPHAPLQFSNAFLNRKVVLYEAINNDHEFAGFGMDGFGLRYQLALTGTDHVFYAATSGTSSNELLRIKGNGNVGIGISSPNAPLQFSNMAANRKIVLGDIMNNDHQFKGFGLSASILRYQVDAASSDHVFFAGATSSTSQELMRIRGNGNVGIGTTGSNAPLQFANTVVNRKIVLFEANNNNHEFHGFGVNSGAMRYQVALTSSDHVFFASTSATTSAELMRIKGNGNVGIGTTNPNAPLQFANNLVNRKVVLFETNNNDHEYHGLGVNSGAMRYQVSATTNDHIFYAGANATTSNELIRIRGNGNVGIGTSSPNAPLQFSNTLSNRKIVINETANNNHQFAGFGMGTNVLRYQVAATGADHAFFAGIDATFSAELMRIKGNGNVGIGTTQPNAPLQFANQAANRKIVLQEVLNNQHQYKGFGTSTSTLRYQVAFTNEDHVFYAAVDALSSDELMRIKGNGNVGIGTSAPNALLQLANYEGNRKIVLFESANNDHQYSGFGTNGAGMRYQVTASTSDHVFYTGSSSTTSTELFRIKGNGNIGIGMGAPNAPLQFSNSTVNRKIVLFEASNNDHQFIGLGINSNVLRYQANATTTDHVFYAGTSASTSNELMRIRGTGNVAITGEIETEAFVQPTLQSGFGNLGGGYGGAAYSKDKMGYVHLRGVVHRSASHQFQVIFTLPVGYRPPAHMIVTVVAEDKMARVDILSTGEVQVQSDSHGFLSLDNITFKAQ